MGTRSRCHPARIAAHRPFRPSEWTRASLSWGPADFRRAHFRRRKHRSLALGSRSVVVVGAGTVGLTTGIGLARRGFDVTILERQTAPADGPRDMVYHWCVLPFFADLGMLDGMTRRGIVCTEYSWLVLATGENLRLDLSALDDVTERPFNLHVTQSAMAGVAADVLGELPDARMEWGVEVTDIQQDQFGVTVSARRSDGENATYRADWVIGADGSHSVVRRSLGLSFAGMTWSKRLISCDLRFDLATLGHAVASTQLDPTHGAVIGKVDATGLWRYTSAENRTLPAEQVGQRALEAITTALRVEDPNVQALVPYRVHQRSADAFRVGRAILVGDAAHLTNPTLAYGMLSGLFDARLLVDLLPAVDTLGDDVLDDYSTERHRNFWDFTSPRSSSRMEMIFSPGSVAHLEERVEQLREIASSRDEARRFFLDDLDCESASPLEV